MKKAILFLISSCFLLGCSQQGYLLRYDVKAGDVFTYETHVVFPEMQNIEGTFKMTITATDTDGEFVTMSATYSDMVMGGVPISDEMTQEMLGSRIKFKVDKMGNTMTVGDDANNQPTGMSGIPSTGQSLVFPEHRIKPGDSWSSKVNESTFTYTFLREEKVEGKSALLFSANTTNLEGLTLNESMKYWVNPDNGMLIKGELKGVHPETGKMHITFKLIK